MIAMQDFLKKTIKEAGQIAKGYFMKGVTYETKAHLGDLLTIADKEVNTFLVSAIAKAYPDHSIYSEEQDEVNPGQPYRWVIDPIDGTRNFANAIPMWCVMVAVIKDGEAHMAAVYDPLSDELFFAEDGKGATLNGLPIRVNDVEKIAHSLCFCVRSAKSPTAKRYAHAVSRIALETNVWMQNFGTMLGTLYVATGGADFCINDAGSFHDHVAPELICREAGAKVTDSDGNEWKPGRTDVVIANPKLHGEVMRFFEGS